MAFNVLVTALQSWMKSKTWELKHTGAENYSLKERKQRRFSMDLEERKLEGNHETKKFGGDSDGQMTKVIYDCNSATRKRGWRWKRDLLRSSAVLLWTVIKKPALWSMSYVFSTSCWPQTLFILHVFLFFIVLHRFWIWLTLSMAHQASRFSSNVIQLSWATLTNSLAEEINAPNTFPSQHVIAMLQQDCLMGKFNPVSDPKASFIFRPQICQHY